MTKTVGVLNNYAVVTLYRNDETDWDPTVTLFLEPGSDVETHCAYYLQHGYIILNVRECTHEDFLNEQVNVAVNDYMETETEFDYLKYQLRKNELTLDDYLICREVVFESRTEALRDLYHLMALIAAHDYDMDNEVATAIYNYYF